MIICSEIRLNGEDSVRFVEALLRPALGDIDENTKVMERIDRDVILQETDNGFNAQIKNLDLSFLDDIEPAYEKNPISIHVQISVPVYEKTVFFDSHGNVSTKTVINIIKSKKDGYEKIKNCENLLWAA